MSREFHTHIAFIVGAVAISAVIAQRPSPVLPPPFSTPSATNFPKVIGWPANTAPKAPEGFEVDSIADLESPRWIYVLPNKDILIAQSKTEPGPDDDARKIELMKAARAIGDSPDRITLLRDNDGDGRYETQKAFLTGLKQPFGMAHHANDFYVANTDSIVQYPYHHGADHITQPGRKITDLPAGGYNNHWTRNILLNSAGTKLYVTVGSQTNVDQEGRDANEPRRAAILEMNPDGTRQRIFASGLRNPNGMDWRNSVLWTVVNERDEIGDDLVPDFLTSVRDGGFYGWPYSYFGKHEDPRQKGKRPDLVAKAIVPDLAVGAHTATLGLAFYNARAFPAQYRDGAFLGQHGSWNRSKFSGYKVAFVPFRNGQPAGGPADFLTGFIANEAKSEVYGRPVGVAVASDGSLLVADDAGNKVWRVRYAKP